MKKHPIGTIINFCSSETRFIKATLEQALLFSQQVIVPVCDHFFDGTLENRQLLEEIYRAFPDCLFIEYPYLTNKIPKKVWKKIDPSHFWHNFSRLVGFSSLEDGIEMVLFLDADEVPEGRRFAEWLDWSDYRHHTTLKLANYWYFREPCNQASEVEDSIVLVQKGSLESDLLLHKEERNAIYNLLPGPKRRHVAGADGRPMFHHYSWVRTKEEMLKKIKFLEAKANKNWLALIDQEFSAPFQGTDFINGYKYQVVSPPFDIQFEPPHFEAKGLPKVKKLAPSEVLKLIRKKNFWNFLDF